MEAVLTIRGLTKRYGSTVALDHVDLDVQRGEIFALLGPNGAGKTTLINIVAGLTRPTSGSARVLGHDVIDDYRFTRRAVGLVPQEINFDPFFTVSEALRFQAGYFGVRLTEDRLAEILQALDLWTKRDAGSRTLSGGMKRRLLIGKALVHAPQVLFLDEPTAGVDVEMRQSLWRYVRTLQARGTSIVLTTHYLEEAEELAERIAIVDHGKLLLTERKEDLLRRYSEKTLTISLTARLVTLPESLRTIGAQLAANGLSLSITAPPGEDLGRALAAVAAAGVAVRDVETHRARLEDIFVSLLHQGAAA